MTQLQQDEDLTLTADSGTVWITDQADDANGLRDDVLMFFDA